MNGIFIAARRWIQVGALRVFRRTCVGNVGRSCLRMLGSPCYQASTSSDFLSHARTREFDDAGDGHNPGEDDGRDMVNGGKRDDTDNPDAGRP